MHIVDLNDQIFNKPELVGGKATQLAWLSSHSRFDVPPGFSFTTQFFEAYSTNEHLISEKLRDHLLNFVKEDTYYAVRSSHIFEDGVENSFAGLFDSYLGVNELDSLVNKILECSQSHKNERVERYRKAKNMGTKMKQGAVIIQEMVPANISGVLFTMDPIQKTDTVLINSSYGLGDILVEGKITPDEIKFSRDSELLSYSVGSKRKLSFLANGVEIINVPESLRKEKSISIGQASVLVEECLRLEKKLGYGLDFEWALASGKFFLLQVRPITYHGHN